MNPSNSKPPSQMSRRDQLVLAWTKLLLPILLVLLGSFVVVARPDCAPYVDEVHRQLPLVVPMAPVQVPLDRAGVPCDPSELGHEHQVEPKTPEGPESGTGDDGAHLVPGPPTDCLALGLPLRAAWAPPGRAGGGVDASAHPDTPFTRSQSLSGAGDVPRSPLGSSTPHMTLAALRRRTRS